jgi:hypothetical protein
VNRDELLEQHTKDLKGLVGQFRAFDLAGYASDYPDESGKPVPWTVGDDAIPDKVGVSSDSVVPLPVPVLVSAGVSPSVSVLHVCDYQTSQELFDRNQKLHREISLVLPGWRVSVINSIGPFEDDEGNGAHFDAETKRRLKDEKLVKATRVDLFTSCCKVLRDVVRHLPDVLYGEGQGGFVVAALRKPLVLEAALQSRNVQRQEAQSMAEAWAKLRGAWIKEPRLGRAVVGHELFLLCCPEVNK